MPLDHSPSVARRRASRRLAIAFSVAVLVAVAVPALLRHQPAATRAVPLPAADAERAAARLVTKASALAAGLERSGEWGEAITDGEANAWLAVGLPGLSGSSMPAEVRTLSIRFLPGRLAVSGVVGPGLIGARWWAVAAIELPRPNRLAVAIDSAGAGLIPLPPRTLLDAIAGRARAAGCTVTIREDAGRPVLEIELPGKTGSPRGRDLEYHLEGLRLDEGELTVAGRTGPSPRR